MNLKTLCFIAVVFVCTTNQLHAQDSVNSSTGDKKEKVKHQMNFVKFNLMGIALKNYSFTYERILTKTISLSASYRFMPTGKIPFAGTLAKAADDDDVDTKNTIENLRIGNYAITPELRFYLGKGYGKGFYIALFYRYASFTADHIPIDYDDTHSLDLSGKLTSN